MTALNVFDNPARASAVYHHLLDLQRDRRVAYSTVRMYATRLLNSPLSQVALGYGELKDITSCAIADTVTASAKSGNKHVVSNVVHVVFHGDISCSSIGRSAEKVGWPASWSRWER
jgi:hypothetical protein